MARVVRSPVKIAAFFLFVLLVLEMFPMAFNGKPVLVVKAQSNPPFSDVADIHNVGPYAGCYPQYVVYDPSNGYLYVTVTNPNTVSVVDPSSNSVVTRIPVGSQPVPITYDSSNGNIYVGNTGGYGSVSVVSGATNTVITTIRLNPSGFATPAAMAYDSANQNVYVAVSEGLGQGGTQGGVVVISGSTNSVTATIVLPIVGGETTPNGVAFDPANNEVYVCAGYVYYINAQNQFSSPISVFPSAAAATLTYDSQNQNLYVTSLNNHYVGVVYSSSNTAGPIIQIVPPYTFADAFDPLTNEVFVTINPSDIVSVVEPSSNTVSYSITLPSNSYPEGIAWDSSNGNLYVVESNLNILSVLSNGVSPSYTVSITAQNGGLVNYGTGVVSSGQTVQVQMTGTVALTANPDLQHAFLWWTTSGSVSALTNTSSTSLVVNGNGQITANFTSNLAIYITPGAATIQLGKTVTFIAYAFGGSGSYYYEWIWTQGTSQGSSSGTSNQYSFTPSNVGTYGIIAYVTDSEGNKNLSPESTVTVQSSSPPSTGNLQVLAYDGYTGFPVSGATAKMNSSPTGTLLSGNTDSGGQYTWQSLQAGAYAVSVSANGYQTSSGSAYVLGGQTDEILVILKSQSNPYSSISAPSSIGQSVTAFGNYIYYADTPTNEVLVFSQVTGNLFTQIPVGHSPISLTFLNCSFPTFSGSESNIAYIACVNQGDGTLSLINTTTNTVQSTVNVGSEPVGIAADNNTAQIFVTNFADNTMSVINLIQQFPRVTSYNIPLEGHPTGIAVDIRTNIAYISIYDVHSIEIVQVSPSNQTYSFSGTINVNAFPLGIAEDMNSNLWVADSGSASISRIQAPISPSSEVTTFLVRNNPVDVAAIYSTDHYVSVFVSYSSSNYLTFISDALWETQQPLTDLPYSNNLPGIAPFNSTAIVTVNTNTNSPFYVNTVPVTFKDPANSGSAFVINNNLLIGAPYIDLPALVYMPEYTYQLAYNIPAGYTYTSLVPSGLIGLTNQNGIITINVQEQGSIALNTQPLENWQQNSAFSVLTYSINLGQIGGITLNAKLAQYPLDIYVITASSGATQTQFTQQVSQSFNINVPSSYDPKIVLLVSVPVVQIYNAIFNANLPQQTESYSLNAFLPAAIFGGNPALQTDSNGNLNIAVTISQNNQNANIVNDVISYVVGYISGQLQNLIKPTDQDLLQTLQSTLDTVVGYGDLSVNVVTTNLNQVGALSSYTLLDIVSLDQNLKQLTTADELFHGLLDILSFSNQLESDSLIPPPAGEALMIKDGVQLGFAYFNTLLTVLPIVFPSLNSNSMYSSIENSVSWLTGIVDPNGTTIIPSYYEGTSLILGYNSTSGDIIYDSTQGTLFEIDSRYYIAYFYENTTNPSSCTLQLNQVGGNDTVPYAVTTTSYSATATVEQYAGILNGTDLSISTIPESNGSLNPQTLLCPQTLVVENRTGYDVYATAFTNDGAIADADTGSLILNGTTYVMQALNTSTFEYTIPYAVASNSAIVYLNTPGFAGGYASVQLPPYVGITAMNLSKTIVGGGYAMNASVAVTYLGDYPATFNVTAYANATSIASQTASLSSGDSTTLTFTWNTTGFALGNYTMSAYAWPVQNETDTTDNNMTSGTVYVGIPGDLNGDGIVNILDAIKLGNHFLETPSSLGWNQGGNNADINGDGIVNILDAIILGNHFLQHYP